MNRKRRRKHPFSPTVIKNLKKNIKRLTDLGYSDQEICYKLRISRCAFYQHRDPPTEPEMPDDENTVFIPQGRRKLTKAERLQNASVFIRSGMSLQEGAWFFNRKEGTIRQWVRELKKEQEHADKEGTD